MSSSDLCLYLTLNMPINRANIKPMRDEKALICPATPTDTLNVKPISMRSNPVISPDGCVANLANTSEGNVSFLESFTF